MAAQQIEKRRRIWRADPDVAGGIHREARMGGTQTVTGLNFEFIIVIVVYADREFIHPGNLEIYDGITGYLIECHQAIRIVGADADLSERINDERRRGTGQRRAELNFEFIDMSFIAGSEVKCPHVLIHPLPIFQARR